MLHWLQLKLLGILIRRKLSLPDAEGTKDNRKKTSIKDKHTLSLDVKSVEIEIKMEKKQKKIKVQLKEFGNNERQ